MYGFIGDHRRRALLLPEVRQRAHFQAVFNPVVYKCMCTTTTVCVAAANLKLKQLLFGLRRRRIYISRYIYLYAFFIHASLPCYITILLVYLSCMLVQKNVLLLLMNALSLIISVEGGTGLWSFFLTKILLLFFSWKCCLIINKCVYVCVFSVWMSFIWRKRLLH